MHDAYAVKEATLAVMQLADRPLDLAQVVKKVSHRIDNLTGSMPCVDQSLQTLVHDCLVNDPNVTCVNGYYSYTPTSGGIRSIRSVRIPTIASVRKTSPSYPASADDKDSVSGRADVPTTDRMRQTALGLSNTDTDKDAGVLHRRASAEDVEELRKLCKKYGLTRLHYLAPLDNVPSILDHGILPKNRAPAGHKSFADKDINFWRSLIRPLDGAKTLHDYVPLFFASKPPLLYRLQELQPSLAYFRINPKVLLEVGAVFSSINAVSAERFYSNFRDLDQLDWEILHAEYWAIGATGEKRRQNKLHRQAEADIPDGVPINMVVDIGVYDRSALDVVKRELTRRELSTPVRIMRNLYY